MYRVNFQNGQVSESFRTYTAAKKYLLATSREPWSDTFKIEMLDNCEWWFLGSRNGTIAGILEPEPKTPEFDHPWRESEDR